MYIMEVGKVIKIKRIEKDLKVKELASKVDITEQYMSNIEHGKRNPSLKLLKKLAKELGCSVYEFIEEQGGWLRYDCKFTIFNISMPCCVSWDCNISIFILFNNKRYY